MNKCLLCQEASQEKQLFTEIFLIRKRKATLCQNCQSQFEPVSDVVCPFCCRKNQEEICSDCAYWKRQGKETNHIALYHYNEKMMEYFSRYKFHGDYCLRKVFAKDVRLALLEYKNYIVVPIPISDKRYEERGFNQVTGILEAAGVDYQPILKKHHAQKQSEKNRKDRLRTNQSFYIEESNLVPEKIILVDDIYTTGATIQLAKALLMKNGAKTIKTFSISR